MKVEIVDFSFFASIALFFISLYFVKVSRPHGSSHFLAANTLLYPNNYTLFFNLN